MKNPGRLITAMVTPFNKKGEICKSRTSKLVKHLIDNKTDCILVSGTTGESPTLSDDEKVELLGYVKACVPTRYPVMFGAGTNSTKKSIELGKRAKTEGADFLLLVVPYYNKPTQEGMYRHFIEIVESVHMPAVVYNIPSRTGVNMNPETTVRLSEHELIIGIKEASGNLDTVSTIRALANPEFLIYSGDDSLTLPMLSIGANGVISVASHLVGKYLTEMIDSFFVGKVDDARRIHLELFPLFKGLFFITNPIAVKAALNLMGVDVGGLRPPLYESDDVKEKLVPILAQYGLVSL